MSHQRRHRRVQSSQSAALVRLRYEDPSAPEINRMVFCSTADLAMHGLRLNVDQPIPVGTPVGVTVIFRSPAHHFRHVGKVRWLKNDESVASYTVGIEFAPKSNADMYAWREFLEATFPDVLANPADS